MNKYYKWAYPMKVLQHILLVIPFIILSTISLIAGSIIVNSQQAFDTALNSAMANDTIIWKSGSYSDIFMDIDKDRLVIKSEELGSVIFNGSSRVDITGDYITLEGFQYIKGDIGTNDVINTRGSYNIFRQINIREYTSYKYLRVREESQYCQIIYCNFENRINLADQNILSILVSDNQPGYHKIQHCSFKYFEGGGNDDGIEPIRIGLSTQAKNISRTLVEYCYFTQCNGDGELISSKATQNVYRYNTFDDNPKAELVLRHGDEAIVYSNFFLNGKGGVRVREGQNHYIYNNYFYRLNDRPIYLQNESSDPLDNINIAFNTIIECDEIILGGSGGNNPPTNVTFANNLIGFPIDDLFEETTGNETWLGNITFGNLGISSPNSGITQMDPKLERNSASFFGISEDSPAIDASVSGFAPLPQFEGMDPIDTAMHLDLMKQQRPASINDKDVGCNEYPHNVLISPFATEANTGPSYDTDAVTSIRNNAILVADLISFSPNPVTDELNIIISKSEVDDLRISIFNIRGEKVLHPVNQIQYNGTSWTVNTTSLPTGMYMLAITGTDSNNRFYYSQNEKFVVIR